MPTGLALSCPGLFWECFPTSKPDQRQSLSVVVRFDDTAGAGGDFLILWLTRHVKAGMQVEDHPTNAGCYVLEP